MIREQVLLLRLICSFFRFVVEVYVLTIYFWKYRTSSCIFTVMEELMLCIMYLNFWIQLYVEIRLLGDTWWHGVSCFSGGSPPFLYSLFNSDAFWSLTGFILATDMYIRDVNLFIVSGNWGVGKNCTGNRSYLVFHWKFLVFLLLRYCYL